MPDHSGGYAHHRRHTPRLSRFPPTHHAGCGIDVMNEASAAIQRLLRDATNPAI